MMELISTLLPEPVEPAIKRWGIFSKSTTQGRPETSLPRQMDKLEARFLNSAAESKSFSLTRAVALFGTSMPTKDRPGIGASMRKGWAAKAKDKSLERAVMRESLA